MIDFTPPPALLVIDAQRGIDDPRWGRRNNLQAEAAIAALLAAWRDRDWPVIHVHHVAGDPASAFAGDGARTKTEAAPRNDELVVWKPTPCAFTNTGLDRLLRARGINRLTVCGFTTNNAVEASVRSAATQGYQVEVVTDACATFDKEDRAGRVWRAEEVHTLGLANLDGVYAEIVSSDDLLAPDAAA
jgi:nicotinamidase-related amidase